MKAILKLAALCGAAYVAQVVIECSSIMGLDAFRDGPLSDVEFARLTHASPGTLALYDYLSGVEEDMSTLARQADERVKSRRSLFPIPTSVLREEFESDPLQNETAPCQNVKAKSCENEPAASMHPLAGTYDAADLD